MATSSASDLLGKVETTFNEYFAVKAPPLPANVKDVFSPLALVDGPQYGATYFLALAFLLAGEVLWGLAIPGLFKQTRRSWQYLFWGELLNCVYNLISFNFVSLIVGGLIGFYFLFQIRDRFTK